MAWVERWPWRLEREASQEPEEGPGRHGVGGSSGVLAVPRSVPVPSPVCHLRYVCVSP